MINNKLFTLYKSKTSPQVTVSESKTFKHIIANYLLVNEKVFLDKSDIVESINFGINEHQKGSLSITTISIESDVKFVNSDILMVSGEGETMIGISSTYTKVLLQILEELNATSIIEVYPDILGVINCLEEIWERNRSMGVQHDEGGRVEGQTGEEQTGEEQIGEEQIGEEQTGEESTQEPTQEPSNENPTESQSEQPEHSLGNIELVYQINNKNLNQISINLTPQDFKNLSPNFISNINSFIYKTTKLKLEHLQLIKFISNNLLLTNGKFKVMRINEWDVIQGLYSIITNSPIV